MLLDLIMTRQEIKTIFDIPSGKTSNEEATKVFLKWQSLPEIRKKEITSFLESTVFYYETEGWIFVHATINNSNVTLHLKLENELIWNYELEPLWQESRFVNGHYTTEEITYNGQGININTLCGYGGVLTGLLNTKNNQNIFEHYSISEDGKI
jgi:hypothetical protein